MNTRERIVQFLQMYRQAGAADMADAMGMTRANLRYHLAALKEAGLVEEISNGSPAGRGRPARVYRLTLGGRPDNFSELAGALLTVHFNTGLIGKEIDRRVQELAATLTADTAPSQAGLTQKLGRAVQWLDAHGYAGAWEARPQGPVLRLRNCPYATLVKRHPELCRMDAALLERLTGLTARQIAWIDLQGGAAPACVFSLKSHREPNEGLD